MYEFFGAIKNLFDNVSIVIFIIMGMLILIIDGSKYTEKKYERELKIVKFFSYFYIVFGIVIFAILMIS